MRSGNGWHINCEHAQKFSVGIEDLNAPVGAIANVKIVVAVDHDGVRQAELPRLSAFVAPGFYPVSVLVIFRDARVDVSVGDVDVAVRIPGHVGGLAEESVDGGKRRIWVAPRFSLLFGSLGPAAEYPNYAACLIEFDDHVGTFVDGPDVVVLVDAHAVSFGPGVEAFADFTDVRAIGAELEELRGRGGISWPIGAVGTREDEDVALGMDGHAGNFAEIHSGRKLEEIRNGVKSKF